MRIKRLTPKEEVKQTEAEKLDMNLLNPLIETYRNKKGNLIPLLQGTQDIFGYLPGPAFIKISRETGLKLNDMYGVATFYAQFRLVPAGKYIVKMCHGTACHVQSVTAITDEILDTLQIKDGETTSDGLFTIETVACLGCCSLAPVMMIGDETYGKLTPRAAVKIIRELTRTESK
jgi:NADH-quinone oxidoreductase subunit E